MAANAAKFSLHKTDSISLTCSELIHAFMLVYLAIVKCPSSAIHIQAGQLWGSLQHLSILAFKKVFCFFFLHHSKLPQIKSLHFFTDSLHCYYINGPKYPHCSSLTKRKTKNATWKCTVSIGIKKGISWAAEHHFPKATGESWWLRIQ